ncbi:MAG: hypothetical protein M3136_07430 [Thermoproteota archaeon]|nr:hypothetical protein [Thermoproteota archaeon]
MVSGGGDETNQVESGGSDKFVCSDGEEGTVNSFNAAERDTVTPDCENINPR